MKKKKGIRNYVQERTKRFSLVVLLAIVCFIVLLVAVLLAFGKHIVTLQIRWVVAGNKISVVN